MPKWKKDTKEFEVSVNYVETRGASSSIPKPIIEMLGNPQSIKFILNDNNEVVLVSGNPTINNKIIDIKSNNVQK